MNSDFITILKHTRTWAWVLLVFLIYRGWAACKDRTVTLARLLTIPIIFLLWPVLAIFFELQNFFAGIVSFIVGLLIGNSIGLMIWKGNGAYIPGNKMFYRKGSPRTLIFVILAFLTKYILFVHLHLHPDENSNVEFAFLYGGLSGIWDGLFWGGVILLFKQMKAR